MKPSPAFIRYVIPIVPAMLILAVVLLHDLSNRLPASLRPAGSRALAAIGIVALVLLPARVGWQLVAQIGPDTRVRAEAWRAVHPGEALFEGYSLVKGFDVVRVSDVDLAKARAQGISRLVASSFMYDRFLRGARLPDQDQVIYETATAYERILGCPREELRPAYRSFAFSNPTILLIDITACPD